MNTRLIRKIAIFQIALLLTVTGCKTKPIPQGLEVSKKDPLLVFVGTYTQKEGWVDGKAKGVYIYKMDPLTGALNYVATSPNTISPSFVVIHPNKKWLYAANELGVDGKIVGTISAFKIDTAKKELIFMNSVSSHGNYTCHVGVDLTGKFVTAASYGTGTVAVFPIQPDGSLKEASFVDQHKGNGPNKDRQAGPHAHMLTQGFDKRYAYGIDLGIDKIILYQLDTIQGKLISTGKDAIAQPGAGPRQLTFHPNKKWAYLIDELNGTVVSYTVDYETGILSSFQVISTVEEGKSAEAASADIHITPSGKYLYATNRGSVNNIAMYSIDSESGRLQLIGYQSTKGKIPRSFAIDPSGTFLLVANQNSDNIITFRIDPANGKLLDTGLEAKVPTPVCLKFY